MKIRIIRADGKSEMELLNSLKERSTAVDKQVTEVVSEIIENVKNKGDEAVMAYTKKFDGELPPYLEVPREEINNALTEAAPEFVEALLNAMENITDFHSRQKQQGFLNPMANGVIVGQRVRGLKRVGLYVPGGTAALSFVSADECGARQNRGRGGNRDGHASDKGRQGQSRYSGRSGDLRRGQSISAGRCAGSRSARLRD